MSAAAAAPSKAEAETVVATAIAKPRKKKLIVIGAALAVLLTAGGGGAAFYLKKKHAAEAAAAAEEGGAAPAEAKEDKHDKPTIKNAPAFVPLDPFTVNLADRDAERYAQVALTLELVDAKAGDLLKAYMPAIRNNVLLVLASKTAAQMMDNEGKLQLAAEIRAAALKPLGYQVKVAPRPASGAAAKPTPEDDDPPPIRAVHFSNFIIQ